MDKFKIWFILADDLLNQLKQHESTKTSSLTRPVTAKIFFLFYAIHTILFQNEVVFLFFHFSFSSRACWKRSNA